MLSSQVDDIIGEEKKKKNPFTSTLLLFSDWGPVKLDQQKINEKKTVDNVCSASLGRNRSMSNSERWLELGLTQHLSKEQYVCREVTGHRKMVLGFQGQLTGSSLCRSVSELTFLFLHGYKTSPGEGIYGHPHFPEVSALS